jgi:hypothetical protein
MRHTMMGEEENAMHHVLTIPLGAEVTLQWCCVSQIHVGERELGLGYTLSEQRCVVIPEEVIPGSGLLCKGHLYPLVPWNPGESFYLLVAINGCKV